MNPTALLRDEFALEAVATPVRPAFRRVRQGASAPPEIIVDLSRLLSRVGHSTPTGVDRVEMAYAQTLLELIPERVSFAAVHPAGVYGRLDTRAVGAFLETTTRHWRHGGQTDALKRWARLAELTPLPRASFGRRVGPERRLYLHLSTRCLERHSLYRSILQRERASLITFVHDLIPLDFPEYARPRGAALFRKKLDTITGLSAGIIVNSHATARSLAPWLEEAASASIPVQTALLASKSFTGAGRSTDRPYFLILGTIEPRKNHLLLLHIWRRLAAVLGSAAPKLVVVGRRGWENENILDLLDRSPALRANVEEHQGLGDQAVGEILKSACAVLVPSFAEGYGLPVAEALATGTPVIASNLPALREAGGDVAEYLDPLDGAAWTRAILDYAAPDSLRRQAQLARLISWRAPSWDGHVKAALDLCDAVAGQ
jgi:glycosyltransferase involved in cell wall biosynthesis